MHNDGWIDVSATITDDMTRWPTDAPVKIFRTETAGVNGAAANVTAILSTAHVGTHVDAPLHFYPDGGDIAHIDLRRLMGPAKVIVINDREKISLRELAPLDIGAGDRLLFRTANSEKNWETSAFLKNYVYLSAEAAEYLVNKGVQCVGVDYLSVGGGEDNEEVHRLLLGKEIAIIEGLMLREVDPGDYEMLCLPLKISGSDGAPARALLRRIR